MAQLGIFKTELANFSQHGTAIGMAMGIPASGEGIHRTGFSSRPGSAQPSWLAQPLRVRSQRVGLQSELSTRKNPSLPSLHHATTPSFHYSNTPLFQFSITPFLPFS